MSTSGIYSSHIFMFPFRFDWNEKEFDNEFTFYKNTSINDRVDLKKLHKRLTAHDWKYESFQIAGEERNLLYSEYAYFYDYARDAIYNQDNASDDAQDAISYYYSKKGDLTNSSFLIHIVKNKAQKDQECQTYNLNIADISLRVFQSGVAILSLSLENRSYKNFDDILKINDFGRRIYPQYIGTDGVASTKNSFLADYITIKTSHLNVTENFEYNDFSDTHIGNHILEVLGTNIFTQKRNVQEMFYIQPILDDRMFILSWYGNDELSKKLSTCFNYKDSDDWYKYVFADNNFATVQNSIMKEELLKKATYDRWSNYGTLFGITRYSFVLLSQSVKSLKENKADFIINHTKTMYFQMVTLLLANRASILRFSDEIAAIASSKEIDRLQPLYEKYLTFYNRLYFKEVTHQDQGIELYDIARKQMRIDEHIEKLDNKFTKLFEYADLEATKKHDDFLQLISGIFIFPSLMIALLSMGIFDYKKSLISLAAGLLAVLLSGIVGYKAFENLLNKGEK